MIIVRLAGGLGNQMFQYAAGLRLATVRSTVLKVDLSFLMDRTPNPDYVFRDYDLDIFKLDIPRASQAEIALFRPIGNAAKRTFLARVTGKIIGRRYYVEPMGSFDPRVLTLGRNTYLEGFFQDSRYFIGIDPEIRRRFHLSPDESQLPSATRQLANEIRRDQCICLNVRRGDYVTNANANRHHGVCTIEYYMRALTELRNRGARGRVMVFSDDVPWCRENFRDLDVFTIVDEQHNGERFATKFWLMTLCHDFVIPNSSFAFWAAWLSENKSKRVARPAQWALAPEVAHQDICPPEWVKVPN
jgi:hypothetical protein